MKGSLPLFWSHPQLWPIVELWKGYILKPISNDTAMMTGNVYSLKKKKKAIVLHARLDSEMYVFIAQGPK